MHDVLVSILCPTYNHEDFIADAMESFLMQKTNFKFEIIVHDDASTDQTASIIREYVKQYPDLIHPIYQAENQYSKGVSIEELVMNEASGKYLAVCEGDDFWTDPYKLQKQLEYMENHPECSLCVHAGNLVDATTKRVLSINRPGRMEKEFTVEEVIEGGGGLFLTNTMFIPTELAKHRPAFFKNAPVGDYPLAIHLAILGRVHYMNESMSAYRVGNQQSWTAQNFSSSTGYSQHFQAITQLLDAINAYTNYQYNDTIVRKKEHNHLLVLIKERKFNQVKKGELKEVYASLSLKRKCVIFLEQYSPSFVSFIKERRRWIRWATK